MSETTDAAGTNDAATDETTTDETTTDEAAPAETTALTETEAVPEAEAVPGSETLHGTEAVLDAEPGTGAEGADAPPGAAAAAEEPTPAAVDSPGSGASQDDPGESAGDTGDGSPSAGRAPRRGGRSRRAVRPASAPEHDAGQPAGLDVLAELGAPTAEPPLSTASGASAALDKIVFAAPARPTGEPPAAATAPAAGDQEPPAADRSRDDQETTVDPAAVQDDGPRLPVTALLFQAPDLNLTAHRRRAQSPAGPPSGADVAEPGRAGRREQDQHTPEEGDVDEPDSGGDVEEGESAPSAAQRRRRRRGGRGRRSRAAGGPDAGVAEEDEDEDTTPEGEEGQPAAAVASQERAVGQRSRRRATRGGDGAQAPSPDSEPGDAAADDESSARGAGPASEGADGGEDAGSGSSRRRRRRRRGARTGDGGETGAVADEGRTDEVTALKGSTRLEAKRQRRREGRDAGRRRTVVTEAEFLARRESVERSMVVRERDGRTQIAVLEDGVLVEHFVARRTQTSMVGNVYLGRVQNVLPSMEAAFVDLGKGRNAVLYAGEVNWDAAGMEGQPRRIEQALSSGDAVMVQVTKDPIGHKGARLTSQITLAGRYLVLVPSGAMTGISRKLPDTERARLKKLLREIVPEGAGVIVRTAAEGASEEELRLDVARLQVQWAEIERKAKSASAPSLLHGEPDLAIRVVRDVFNEDFGSVTIAGAEAWDAIAGYIESVAPDLSPRLHRWTSEQDAFAAHRIDEQLTKALDRKVWLPSGGSLVIDRTEAMTVVDVNTGKFTGAGGTLEETVTRNNLEAAEEIVRQLRLRDIGGIIVIDFIDMVLESNRDLVLRRLVECLGRDRTRHQVAEVTSLGLVQMTRKRVGQGLIEAFSETCETCGGRGYLVHAEPVEKSGRPTAIEPAVEEPPRLGSRRRGRRATDAGQVPDRAPATTLAQDAAAREAVKATLATIAAAAAHAHEEGGTTAPEVPASGAESSVAALEQADEPEPVIDFGLLRAGPRDGPAGAVEQQGEPAGAVGQGDQGGSVTQSDSVEQGEPGAVPAVPDAGEHGEAPFAAPTAARDAPNDGQPQDARDAAAHL